MRIWGLRVKGEGSGSRVEGLRSRIQGSWCVCWDSCWDSGTRIQGFKGQVQAVGFTRVQG
jgi:hypothetical protein